MAALSKEAVAPPRIAEERREEILRAGLDLFAIAGFNGTSVRQIAREVGLNEATLYHYFPSKDAILQAVFDRVLAERRSAFTVWQQAEQEGERIEDLLWHIGRVFLQHATTPLEMKVMRLMLSEGPRLSDDGRQAFERMNSASMQPAIDLFQRLMEQGRLRRMDPEMVVMGFFAPLILWKICHSMGQQRGDVLEGERRLRHQVEVVARALAL